MKLNHFAQMRKRSLHSSVDNLVYPDLITVLLCIVFAVAYKRITFNTCSSK